MIWKIMIDEYRYRISLVSTWVYIFLFAGIGFLMANIMGGAFEGVSMTRSGEHNVGNSPLNISFMIAMMVYIFTIAFAAIFGSSAVRDFETGSFELYFTKPLKPASYLMGRFLGAYMCVVTIVLGMLVAFGLGFLMPYLPAHKIGPHHILPYLHALTFFALPNLFLVGAVCFNVGILSRKVINSYILGMGLFFLYLLAQAFVKDAEKLRLAALLDPFGISSLSVLSRYWTTAQTNVNQITLHGLLGWNRLIWVMVGLGITAYAISRFGFRKEQNEVRTVQTATPRTVLPPVIDPDYFSRVKVRPYNSLQQFWHLLRYEFQTLIFNRTFLVITSFFCFFLTALALGDVGKLYGTQTHPITIQVLQALVENFVLFGFIITTFYSGDLLWRDAIQRTDQLYDVTPHHGFVRYFSKLGAVILMQWILLVAIMLVGMIVQLAKGHLFLEPGLYLSYLFIFSFVDMLPLTLMAFFWCIVMNNRYSGYLAMIGFYLIPVALVLFKFNHPMLLFGSGSFGYSDMNGYGDTWPRFFVWLAYWLLLSTTLSLVGFKLWKRGTDKGLQANLQKLKFSWHDTGWRLAMLSLSGFIVVAGLIFYNNNILNEYTSPRKIVKEQVTYEKTYRNRILALPQPRISSVDYSVDMYPSKRSMDVAGSYWLVNRNSTAIDTLVLTYNEDYAAQTLTFDREVTLVESYSPASLSIYSIRPALAPQDSMLMEFAFHDKPKGFPAFMADSWVRKNGTFFHSSIFPSLGYQEGYELSDNNDRKKKGLNPRLRMAAISDSSQYGNPYVSTDSDYVRYKARISTEEGQIAFAPGELEEQRTENGRYNASFSSPVPILNYFAFLSGKYEVARDTYNGVQVEIYHDKKHQYNIASMLESSVNSLKYFSENFKPYPFSALRIVEVPYVYSAQSFPALIPFSENIGFVAKIDPKDDSAVDYPYQVVSHEIGHQWWAHTVIGANVQGATMLSEVFTEYSSLMIVKQKYGKERLRRFLSYTHDNYLRSRKYESREELPLYLNENQGYLHYEKGPLVMFALQDEIGEQAVNYALGAFCRDYAYTGDPFPLSTDVLPYLRRVLPPELAHLVKDLFETITLYDNLVKKATHTYDKTKDEYIVEITISTSKFRADGLGKETSIPLAEPIDIAIYDDKEEMELARKRVLVQGGDETLTLTCKKKPAKVILDPYFKKIDKDRKNNSLIIS